MCVAGDVLRHMRCLRFAGPVLSPLRKRGILTGSWWFMAFNVCRAAAVVFASLMLTGPCEGAVIAC